MTQGSNDLFDKQSIYKAVRASLGLSLEEPQAAWLGWANASGAQEIYVNDPSPDRVGKVYFTFDPSESENEAQGRGEAYNTGPTPLDPRYLVFGTPIYVARDKLTLDWYIAGMRPRAANKFFGGTPPSPSLPGLITGATGLLDVTVPPTMQVVVYNAVYTLNRTLYFVDNLYSDDLTSLIPATALRAILLLVEVDAPANALVLTPGAEFDAVLTLGQIWAADDGSGVYFPKTNGSRFTAGFVRLIGGMATITRGLITPTQEILHKEDYSNILVDGAGSVVVDGGNGTVAYT